MIFHTKYPKNFRASLRNWKKYDFFVVKSWFFARNTPKFVAPPSARRDFFKCALPNLKSWIRPCPVLPVSLDCPFLIAPSVFSNVYIKTNNIFVSTSTKYWQPWTIRVLIYMYIFYLFSWREQVNDDYFVKRWR